MPTTEPTKEYIIKEYIESILRECNIEYSNDGNNNDSNFVLSYNGGQTTKFIKSTFKNFEMYTSVELENIIPFIVSFSKNALDYDQIILDHFKSMNIEITKCVNGEVCTTIIRTTNTNTNTNTNSISFKYEYLDFDDSVFYHQNCEYYKDDVPMLIESLFGSLVNPQNTSVIKRRSIEITYV